MHICRAFLWAWQVVKPFYNDQVKKAYGLWFARHWWMVQNIVEYSMVYSCTAQGKWAIMTNTQANVHAPHDTRHQQCYCDTHHRCAHTVIWPFGLGRIIRMEMQGQCVSQSVGLLCQYGVKLNILGTGWVKSLERNGEELAGQERCAQDART